MHCFYRLPNCIYSVKTTISYVFNISVKDHQKDCLTHLINGIYRDARTNFVASMTFHSFDLLKNIAQTRFWMCPCLSIRVPIHWSVPPFQNHSVSQSVSSLCPSQLTGQIRIILFFDGRLPIRARENCSGTQVGASSCA